MTPDALPHVLFADDLAALLRVSLRQLHRLRKRQGWPYAEMQPRLSRKPRWSRDHVLNVLAGQALPALRRVK